MGLPCLWKPGINLAPVDRPLVGQLYFLNWALNTADAVTSCQTIFNNG